MSLVFVTSNKHKFEEAERVAEGHGIELEHREVPYIEIQSDDLADVSKLGAREASGTIQGPCFVEDAGLFIEALRGFPGPYSSYVFRTVGNEGILKLLEGVDDRKAEFRSAVGYCEPGGEPEVFDGAVEGKIMTAEKGDGGFGFDPIFVPGEGDGRTFAQMSTEEKNELSHRARAIENFLKWYARVKKA